MHWLNRRDSMQQLEDFYAALACETGQPTSAFKGLERLARQIVGVRLFSLMVIDHESATAGRIYSSNQKAYPVQGTKPVPQNEWTRIVLEKRETFVANDIERIAEVFPDHELIRSLGYESVINVPIVVCGRVAGTINCLDEAGHYSPEKVVASEQLKLPGATAFMLHRLFDLN